MINTNLHGTLSRNRSKRENRLSVEEQRKGKNAPKERYVNIACVLQLAI